MFFFELGTFLFELGTFFFQKRTFFFYTLHSMLNSKYI